MANKVLIIEDDVLLLTTLKEAFTKSGFEVETASDGDIGISIAKDSGADVVVLDLLMPKVNGLTVLENIRSSMGDWGKTVPVFILTNYDPQDDPTMKSVLTHEPVVYLEKSSWQLEDIVGKVRQALENK